MSFANFLGGGIVLFFGLIVRIFKASYLIAGYNTASKEEKAKYDEDKLTKSVGNMLIISSIVLILGGILTITIPNTTYIAVTSWILFAVIIFGGLIYINTGNRVKK